MFVSYIVNPNCNLEIHDTTEVKNRVQGKTDLSFSFSVMIIINITANRPRSTISLIFVISEQSASFLLK